jgi:adenosyl cobinamide kinase/adenosyl cobinamide phosphate guanylyltransferase/NaMN:DMB phosphoribosyltransferase
MAPLSSLSASPPPSARRVLLLGGVRSGKSALAESLAVGSTDVRYVATSARDDTDPAWAARLLAHRERRPATWTTEETGADLDRLAGLLAGAGAEETILVDDLGGWLTAVFTVADRWDDPAVATGPAAALASAVAASQAAMVIMVAPEVGLSVVPENAVARTFADANGALNRTVAAVCDAVALVVAGRPVWLPGGARPTPDQPAQDQPAQDQPTPDQAAVPAADPGGHGRTVPDRTALDLVVSGISDADAVTRELPMIVPSVPLPVVAPPPVPQPDHASAEQAAARILGLDVPGTGLGALAAVLGFAAATQRRPDPAPWRQVHTMLLRGDHTGGAAAGDGPEESARRLARATAGDGVLALLSAQVDARIIPVQCPESAPIEVTDALTDHAVGAAIERGRLVADNAVDSGADLLVLASCGSGAAVAAAAVIALLGNGEPATLLPRAARADGTIDDESWMRWCETIRDATHRIRSRPWDGQTVLTALGGGDVAVAAGILLGAAARRTPVLIDGPVGAAATLVARDIATDVPGWVLLPDSGAHPAVDLAATLLSLQTLVGLRLGLGEGAGALAMLPVLRTSLAVSATIGG